MKNLLNIYKLLLFSYNSNFILNKSEIKEKGKRTFWRKGRYGKEIFQRSHAFAPFQCH